MYEIHKLLFNEDLKGKAMHTINFYNQVKKIIVRSGGPDKVINIRIFFGLIRELRIKLDITKAGYAADKTMRAINFGLETRSNQSALRTKKNA